MRPLGETQLKEEAKVVLQKLGFSRDDWYDGVCKYV